MWNTEYSCVSPKHIKSIGLNPNISKYWEFSESIYWVWTQKVIWHPNMSPTFLLLYAITNEKTLKLTQIDRMLAASKIIPAETRSNNSGR